MAFLESAALAFVVIFLAEIGDKTQWVLVALATRGHRGAVFAAAALAFLLLVLIAVVAADLVGRVVPPLYLTLLGGLLFLAFGVFTLRARDAPEEEGAVPALGLARGAGGLFLSGFGLVFIAELGDKSQFAVLALAAASGEPVAVALGAWGALLVGAVLALGVGSLLAGVVPARYLRIASGIVFLVVGILLVFDGLRSALTVA